MIHDVIWSLVILTEKLPFFNKQLEGFIISLNASNNFLVHYQSNQKCKTNFPRKVTPDEHT